jgi:hypothetical protein
MGLMKLFGDSLRRGSENYQYKESAFMIIYVGVTLQQ